MTTGPVAANWLQANQRHLTAALAVIRARIEWHAARGPGRTETSDSIGAARRALDDAGAEMPAPSALDRLSAALSLTPFEREVLVLCAGVELDSTIAALCGTAQGDASRTWATFSLALAALEAPHWSALAADGALRRWRLIEVGAGSALTTSALRIDERVLHYLAGVQSLDERVAALVEPLSTGAPLAPSHLALAERIAAIWAEHAAAGTMMPVIELCGVDRLAKRHIVAAASDALSLGASRLAAPLIPTAALDLDTFIRLWQREVVLRPRALIVDCDDPAGTDALRTAAIARFLNHVGGPMVVTAREPRRASDRPTIVLEVSRPPAPEQLVMWQGALGDEATLAGGVNGLVSQFALSGAQIRSACDEVRGQRAARGLAEADDLAHDLWDACRRQARPGLDDLALRIQAAATWNDLILPADSRRLLREIAAHVRHRHRVYDTWGFAAKGSRGLGISALFAGSSGTGKTMAAEVLAHELRLDLYRIDLSQVVSKYIGETEKNLRRVFDAAEEGGAILLFDEADALFGKRGEVKDSHDRYANIEVSYLLQRMEEYRGLAILTTNMKEALDTAFLRRLRFVVPFPFPDVPQRAEIWRRIFPANTPTDALAIDKLSRLHVAGGNIRNIALAAAFQAADAEEAVGMSHLLCAARAEYAKIDRPLTSAEIEGWS